MAKKNKYQASNQKPFGIGGYVLLSYWLFFAIIHLTIDLFIDLHTDENYGSVFWCTAVIALVFTAYTIYLTRGSVFTTWYTYLILPLIIYGLYLGTAYFTALKLDVLISAMVKPETKHVLAVKDVRQVFARKAGFIHTNVTLQYQQQLLTFEGTRTSYFLLKPHKLINVKMGQSYLGDYYITHINLPVHERWVARGAYIKNWFSRYYWLLIALPLIFSVSGVKSKYFANSDNKVIVPAKKPYSRFLKLLFIVLFSLVGLFMLVVLLVGLFG